MTTFIQWKIARELLSEPAIVMYSFTEKLLCLSGQSFLRLQGSYCTVLNWATQNICLVSPPYACFWLTNTVSTHNNFYTMCLSQQTKWYTIPIHLFCGLKLFAWLPSTLQPHTKTEPWTEHPCLCFNLTGTVFSAM